MSAEPAASPQPPPRDPQLDAEILRMLMDAIPDRIYFKDTESRFVRVNAAYAKWHGFASPDEVVGKTDRDLFVESHAKVAYADEQAIIHTGQPLIGKIERLTMLDGAKGWASTTKLPWRDTAGRIIGTFGLTRDITSTRDAEEELKAERNLLRTIIDHLPSRIFVKDPDSRFLLSNAAHLQSLGVARLEDARGKTTLDFFPNERGRQAMADDRQVLATGTPILNQEKSDFGTDGDAHWSLTTKVPLHDSQGAVIGLVGISHDITNQKFTEQVLRCRTDEMESDLRMARQVQEAFSPRVYPVFPHYVLAEASELRFAHRYLPAATLGGDFFDILQLSDSRCGVLISDVMGHGVRAGLLTALIRGVVAECAPRASDPALVLAEINESLMPIIRQTGQPVFATAFYGIIDLEAATLTYAIAGHPPPLIRRGASGAVEGTAFSNPEPAAGLMEEFVYSSLATPFLPGDTLLAFTDGIFEACNAEGAMFGDSRIRRFVNEHAALTGTEFLDRLIADVIVFTGQKTFEDDLCALVIESTAKPAKKGRPIISSGL